MEKLLLFIKHRFSFLWSMIELINGVLFNVFFAAQLRKICKIVLAEFLKPPYFFRELNLKDSRALYEMINLQEPGDLIYFKPHEFDLRSIENQFKKPDFLMMGVFDGECIIGYFFLRFFINRKCFVGRLIAKEYRGKGIGEVMNMIMYETAWRMGFRVMSTISKKNHLVMKAHSKNPYMRILKELDNDYLLVEFVKQ